MTLSISMTRRETVAGWIFLGISMLILPTLIFLVGILLGNPLSDTEINLFYFLINFLSAVIIFWDFLSQSVKRLIRTPWLCLRYGGLSYILYRLASILLGMGILWIRPDFSNVNDGSIAQLATEHYSLMSFATVFLVPVYEELLYRGLFFQGLHAKNRVLAYGVSMLVFAMIHVMGYIGAYDPVTLLLCFLQYLPAGAALSWAYEKTDTIATPILMHISINQIAFMSMR